MLTLSAATLLLLTASPSLDLDRYGWTLFDTASHALPSDFVDEIAFDPKGTAWVTTSGLGLARFDGTTWRTVRQPDVKAFGWLHHIEFLPDGRLFIVGMEGRRDVFSLLLKANGDALVSFRDGTWSYPVTADGRYLPKSGQQISAIAFYSLKFDASGTLWGAGYTRPHLFSHQCGAWYEYRDLPPVLHADFTSTTYVNYGLAVLADQRVMISTQLGTGLAVFDGTDWQAYTPPMPVGEGLGAIHLAPDGSVWVASQKGLLVFSDRESTKYPKYVPVQPPQPLNGFTRELMQLPARTTARCLDCPKYPAPAAHPARRDSSAHPARDSTH